LDFGGFRKQERALLMSSDIAISIQGISKAYEIYDRPHDRLKQMIFGSRRKFHEEFWALQNIDFEVRKGETVGIVGRNGSGKSTLLQIICGTVTPTSGSIEKQGRVSALLELGSGFNPEFTGRENVYLNGSILGLTREDMDHRFDRIAAFADIGNFIDSPVKHYSSGMFARLAFSVAIHVDPEILIVDEILAVGDAAFQRRCLSKFYEIREEGCSILFVSHDQYQVKSVCNRALYLEHGQQKMFGDAGRVIDMYMIDTESAESASSTQSTKAGEQAGADPTIPSPNKNPDAGSSAADEQEGAESKSAASTIGHPTDYASQATFPFLIESVRFLSALGEPVTEINCGDTVAIEMKFRSLVASPPKKISFVVNLYRHDGLYICGTTTLMDGMAPHSSGCSGRVLVRFPDLPLLSGRYKWRVAINDHGGFAVLADAKEVCPFTVVDSFNAVGLINLKREWDIQIESTSPEQFTPQWKD
jgi:ABC-type polysaccharide/polyol phosphate transport system ATPase subunit